MIINDADIPQFATPKRLEFENKIIAKPSFSSLPPLPFSQKLPFSLHFPLDQITASDVFDFASTLYIVEERAQQRERKESEEKPHKLYSFIQFNCMPYDFALLIGYNGEKNGVIWRERKISVRCARIIFCKIGFWN